MSSCTIVIRSGRVFVHPLSQTVDGVYFGHGPVVEIFENDLSCAYNSMIDVLKLSRENYPNPRSNEEWKNIEQKLLGTFCDKSRRDNFNRTDGIIHVFCLGDKVEFLPMNKIDYKHGFVAYKGSNILVDINDKEKIGRSIFSLIRKYYT